MSMNITRRGLLGMFAAGAAAAVCAKESLMKVRPSGLIVPAWTDNPALIAADLAGIPRDTPGVVEAADYCDELVINQADEVTLEMRLGPVSSLLRPGDMVSLDVSKTLGGPTNGRYCVMSASFDIEGPDDDIKMGITMRRMEPSHIPADDLVVAHVDLSDAHAYEYRMAPVRMKPLPALAHNHVVRGYKWPR